MGPLHVWHYAVVIGYLATERQIVLRSGTSERRVDGVRRFPAQLAWKWLLGHSSCSTAQTLPATADATRYVESIVPLEALGDTETARAAYATALTRWPDSVVALFGLANTEHKLGRLAAAEQTYRRLLALRRTTRSC